MLVTAVGAGVLVLPIVLGVRLVVLQRSRIAVMVVVTAGCGLLGRVFELAGGGGLPLVPSAFRLLSTFLFAGMALELLARWGDRPQ